MKMQWQAIRRPLKLRAIGVEQKKRHQSFRSYKDVAQLLIEILENELELSMNVTARCLFRLCPRFMCSAKSPYPGDLPLVPTKPDVNNVESVPAKPTFSHELLSHLESLSLVRFDDEQAVVHLQAAVKAAMAMQEVDTTDVEPMYTVWEDQQCPLREDIPEEPLTIKQVLSNASITRDNYFVSPPGNVALEEAAPLDQNLISQWDKLGMEVAPTPKQFKRKEND